MSHLGILTAWNYAWSVLTACFVLGVIVYLLDRKFGVHIYRFAYDFFHRNPMPATEVRGFLVEQSSRRGASVAFFLSTVYSLYMVWELGFSMNFIAELFIWAGMNPMLIGGFWAGRWFYKVISKSDVYLDKADELGEMNVGEVAQNIKSRGAALASRLTSVLPARKEPAAPLVKETPQPADTVDDIRARLEKYSKG